MKVQVKKAEDIASAKFNIDKLSNERFFPDESVTNGSSIVILLEIGQKNYYLWAIPIRMC